MKFKTKLSLLCDTLISGDYKKWLNLCMGYLTYKLEPENVWTTPVYLQLEPTTRCNLRCKMCYGSYKRRDCPDLSFEGFKKIIDQFPKLIKVHLQGIGEPFLNKDIFRMIRYSKSKGIKVDLTTNATLIDLSITKEIISSKLDYIEFSIDSPVPETYENIRAGASFEKILSNVSNLIDERGNANKPEMKVTAVVMDENVDEIPQLVEFTSRMKIGSLFLIHVQPWDQLHIKRQYQNNGELNLRINKAILKAARRAKELRVYIDLSMPIDGKLTRACKRPWLSTSVLADGYVVPCCRVISPDEINFGNLFQDDFSKIWNSAKYKSFRNALKGSSVPAACRNCYYYYRNPLSRDHL